MNEYWFRVIQFQAIPMLKFKRFNKLLIFMKYIKFSKFIKLHTFIIFPQPDPNHILNFGLNSRFAHQVVGESL